MSQCKDTITKHKYSPHRKLRLIRRKRPKNIHYNKLREIVQIAFVEGADYINRRHTYGGMSFELRGQLKEFDKLIDELCLKILYNRKNTEYYRQWKDPFYNLLHLFNQ